MELVKMTKSHVEAEVHPDMVEQYLSHGWVLVEAPVVEGDKPAKKKAK